MGIIGMADTALIVVVVDDAYKGIVGDAFTGIAGDAFLDTTGNPFIGTPVAAEDTSAGRKEATFSWGRGGGGATGGGTGFVSFTFFTNR